MPPKMPPFARIIGLNLVVVDGSQTYLAGCSTPACQRQCVRKHHLMACDDPLQVVDWAHCPYCFRPVPDQADSL
jgi:hypothetical protein